MAKENADQAHVALFITHLQQIESERLQHANRIRHFQKNIFKLIDQASDALILKHCREQQNLLTKLMASSSLNEEDKRKLKSFYDGFEAQKNAITSIKSS